MRVAVLLAHVALDVLDDDDGVVHHQPGGEHDAEQRQRVDGEIQQLDESEGADQRDRNCDRGNQGAAPVLQEDEHHQHDEDDGFNQGLQHFADGVADKRRGVEGDRVLQTGRKAFREPVQLGADGLVHVESVGGGQLAYADADAVVAVEA